MEAKKINVTKDYSLFKRLEGNREVDPKRVQKIKKSINDVGYITSPILVNEDMEIIDGQGRFQALQDLKMPIEYIVEEGIGIKECVSMNVNQTNWTAYDYINTYAEKGIESYVLMQKLQFEFPLIISLDVFSVALFRKERLSIDELAGGGLTITKELYNEAHERLEKVYPLIERNPKSKRASKLAKCILQCFWIDGVDMDKLIARAHEVLSANLVPPMATSAQTMQYIEEIYNRNRRGDYNFIFTSYRKRKKKKEEKEEV